MIFQDIVRRITDASGAVLLTHEIPDVDALASCIVMAETLGDLGKQVVFLTDGPMGAEFDHLPGIQGLREISAGSLSDERCETMGLLTGTGFVLVLDTANLNQIGSVYKRNSSLLTRTSIISIDHHWSNTHFGIENLVEPTTSSTCELVMALLKEMGRIPTPAVAEALLTGILVDTSRFTTTSVTAATLRNAATLMDQGASLVHILARISEPASEQKANLWQTLTSRIAYGDKGRIAYLDVAAAELERLGGTENDLKGLANSMRNRKGVQAAAIFVLRSASEIKVSLRGKPGIDVGNVALRYGGGGHLEAAGCIVEGETLEQLRSEILSALTQIIASTAPTS
jgi:phosphoesterase RecJ-like protein